MSFKSLNAVQYDRRTIADAISFLTDGALPGGLDNQSAVYRFKRKWRGFIINEGHLEYAGLRVVPKEDVTSTLKAMYDDPAVGGGIGRDKFYDKAKGRFLGITKQAVMEFLDNQESYQLNKPYIKGRIVKPLVTKRKNQHWQMDLIVLDKIASKNDGYRYILSVIDVFSKYAWAVPLKRKDADAVAGAVQDLVLRTAAQPAILQSDNGPEFKNEDMTKVMERFGIKQVYSQPYAPQSQGLVENCNGYCKSALRQHFSKTGKKRWVDVLDAIVYNWNTSKHGTTKEVPAAVAETDDVQMLADVRGRIEEGAEKIINTQARLPDLKVGDNVRVSRGTTRDGRRDQWDKMVANWSVDVYRVAKVTKDAAYKRALYSLDDASGQRVKKQYYRADLHIGKTTPST